LIHWIYVAYYRSHVRQVPRFWFLFRWLLAWVQALQTSGLSCSNDTNFALAFSSIILLLSSSSSSSSSLYILHAYRGPRPFFLREKTILNFFCN
jgi:hypothetical protein